MSKTVQTEKVSLKSFVVLSLLILSTGALVVLNLFAFLPKEKNVSAQEEKVLGEDIQKPQTVNYWQAFLIDNPSYLPGIIELTKIKISEEKFTEAKILIEKAKLLNANDSEVKRLDLLLKNK